MKQIFTVILILTAIPVFAQDKIHKIKCITLGEDYKADGGSFVVQQNVGKLIEDIPAITEVNGNFLKGLSGNHRNVVHHDCKGEICGFSLNLMQKDGSLLLITSDFNIEEDACSTDLPSGIFHAIRSKLVEGFGESEKLKAEQAKMGHVFIYKSGQTRQVIKRIQCGYES